MIVAKYKFDNTIADCIPVFNDGYSGYTYTDVVEGNITTRTIECDTLPTRIGFGYNATSFTVTEIVAKSLLEVLDINVNATTMTCMFSNCKNLTSLDVSNLDTTNVINMSYMFHECNNLTSLDVSNFNTSNVTSMSNMFNACKNLTSLDLSNWDTSNVTDMAYMFATCTNLTSLDVSNWDVGKVYSMHYMFASCRSLNTIDVSRWDVKNAVNLYGMFNSAIIETVDISNWNFTNAVHAYAMFYKSSIKHLRLCEFPNGFLYIHNMFLGCTQLEEVNLNNLDLSSVIATDSAKYDIFGMKDSDTGFVKPNNIVKITSHNLNTIEILLKNGLMPDRSSNEVSGKLVTSLRDKIEADEEMVAALAVANWEIIDLVAQYKYDANTYENLIPEFNTEFSSDKYEIYDSVSEIVIDDMVWENGTLNSETGNNTNNGVEGKFRTKFYYSVLPNITYNFSNWVHICWYDSNKKFISYNQTSSGTNIKVTSPSNARYIRLFRASGTYENAFGTTISVKLITRSIESVNGDLPILMRFGEVQDNASDKQYSLLKVLDINLSEVTTMDKLFTWCKNLTEINSNSTTSKVTSMYVAFGRCEKLTKLNIPNITTNLVTNMYGMFTDCNNLTSLDVSNWDTSNVTDMYSMFYSCNNLTSLDISNWDTTNVTNMQSMFSGCNNLTSLDVSSWNTSNVTVMNSMFRNCNNLTSLDVSNFNTSNVNNMASMLNGCNKLTELDVSNFNTSNVTNMYAMFYGCNNLTSLDLSNFNTSNVTTMNSMFYNCNKLTSLDVSRWNTSKVTSMDSMFWKCKNINYLNLNNWNFDKVVSMICIFGTNVGMKMSLETLDIANWEISDSTNTKNLFYIDDESLASIKNIRCNNVNTISNVILPNIPTRSSDNKGQIITSAELSQDIIDVLTSKNWTVVSESTLTKVAEYVYDSKIWNSTIPTFNSEFVDYFIDDVEDENGLVTRTISSMGGLPTLMRFSTCLPNGLGLDGREKALLELLYLNISNLTTEEQMFQGCTNLIHVNTENMINLHQTNHMFCGCTNLTSLDASNFDTSKVTSMLYMFSGCQNLTSLDVSNWDTKNVTIIAYMFQNCNNLTSLDVSNWDTKNVTNMDDIFNNTSLLKDIGMLYCTPSTINKIASNLPTSHTQTIWVQDTKPNECTVVSGVEFKEYKENSVMINLSSPLLQGDRIEVKDGKLCHYHKMGKVVLDGSEDERWKMSISTDNYHVPYIVLSHNVKEAIYNTLKTAMANNIKLSSSIGTGNKNLGFSIHNGDILRFRPFLINSLDELTQWLQQNPTTVVYELRNPYYEDITPLQSDVTLETYLECNMDIYTKLPIKTNLTYLTNITNTSSIEEEINAINEGTDLTNLLEDEINN